jgi:glycosyltransferase involved in cell wall biosynthesis
MDRIVMYTPSSEGGHALYTWELMTALADHPRCSWQMELVTSRDLDRQLRGDAYPIHAILPPLLHRMDFSTKFAWAASRVTHYARRDLQFVRWLGEQPEVAAVHFQEWTPWLAGPMFRRIRRMGKKIFYTVHNIVPHKHQTYYPRPLMYRWIRQGCRLCDALFVHTPRLADELKRFLGPGHPPIEITPHGVWSQRDSTPPLPLPDRMDRKRLLFFGSIRRNKGLDLLLRAAGQLPDYSITIAGEAEDRAYLNERILPLLAELRQGGAKIDWRDGFTPEEQVLPLLKDHSAIVMPYTRDFVSQSGVVFLAMAGEMPVVATDVGGLRDLFDEFSIGVSFQDHTPEALAAAVRRLFEQTDRARLLEQLRAARRQYSWTQCAAATLRAYAAVLEQATISNDCPVPNIAAG